MIDKLREQIDKLDDKIVDSFIERLKLTDEIGKIKAEIGADVCCPDREAEIIDRLTKAMPTAEKRDIKKLYRTILSISKSRQRTTSTAKFKGCLIGENVSKSLSKKIHGYLGTDYDLISLKQEDLKEFFGKNNYDIVNVTMPYKRQIFCFLDGASKEAKEIGSVNTVIIKNGKKWGYNTDIDGLRYVFKSKKVEVSGKNIVVSGTGGTAQTAKYLMQSLGAKKVTLLSRQGEWNYENYHLLSDTEVFINATPKGSFDYTSPVDLENFPRLQFCMDVIYSPLKTKLILQAEKLKIQHAQGLEMLVAQAVYAQSILTGKDLSRKIPSIYKRTVKGLKNIVLIGMPSAGKTYIGKKIATSLNVNFIDTDEEITRRYGSAPEFIITKYGEKYFRQIENEVVNDIAFSTSSVIATGGGTVINEENLNLLKMNGFIVYLERDLDKLSVEDRPISQVYGTKALYKMRNQTYIDCCDMKIFNDDANLTASKIVKEYEKNLSN